MKDKIEIKQGCFAFRKGKNGNKCIALNDLYCQREKCNFYKSKLQNSLEKKAIKLKLKNRKYGRI